MDARKSFFHDDIRWHPELQEWFCAKCGQTSDHKAQDDAVAEMSAFECSLLGTRAKKLANEQLKTRPVRH